MLSRDQILHEVRAIIAAEAGFADPALIEPTFRLHHELKTDTLCLLNVYGALEHHFGIEFTMVELTAHGYRDGLTVADLVAAVAGKLQPSEAVA